MLGEKPAFAFRDSEPDQRICLYCQGAGGQRLFTGVEDRLRYVPGKWDYWKCNACGSAVLVPFPRSEQLAGFYPPVYGFAPDVGGSGVKALLARLEYRYFFHPQFVAQARRVVRGAPGLPPKPRLLDIGCGRGLRLLAFRERGFEVHGLDFQPEVAAYVRKRFGFSVACSPVEDMSRHFEPGSFDLLTAFYVLEHVLSVRALLESCYAMLRPGGWLAAAVPFVDSFQARLFRNRSVLVSEAPRHASLPSQRGLSQACTAAGFEEVTIRPDAALACAGVFGLSLFPQAATTAVYGTRRIRALMFRLLGAAGAATALPWCLVENHVLRRPALGIVFARKPLATDEHRSTQMETIWMKNN